MRSNIEIVTATKRRGSKKRDARRREREEFRARVRDLERSTYELIGRAKAVEDMLARGARAR